MVVEAPESGALHIVAAEGETLPVGAPIAAIGEGASAAPRAPEVRPEIEGQGLQEAVDHSAAEGEARRRAPTSRSPTTARAP